MSQSYLLVANPTAQSGRSQARIALARKGLQDMGREVTFLPTEPEGRTVGLVHEALELGGYDVVVAMGGDGTFSEVAQGLLASGAGIPMGLLPSGTANDQGKSFGLSASPAALTSNLETLVLGHVRRIDVGRVERLDASGTTTAELLFFDSAGWGMSPDILSVRNRDREIVENIPFLRELYRDQAVYVGASVNRYLASWVEPTKFKMRLDADGETYHYEGLTDVIINATPIYAANWVLDRNTEPDDGRFEMIPIQGRRDWVLKLVKDRPNVAPLEEHLEALGIPFSRSLSASSFDLTLSRPDRPEISAQVDGEEWVAGQRFRVTVLPRHLPLIVPRGFQPPWKE